MTAALSGPGSFRWSCRGQVAFGLPRPEACSHLHLRCSATEIEIGRMSTRLNGSGGDVTEACHRKGTSRVCANPRLVPTCAGHHGLSDSACLETLTGSSLLDCGSTLDSTDPSSTVFCSWIGAGCDCQRNDFVGTVALWCSSGCLRGASCCHTRRHSADGHRIWTAEASVQSGSASQGPFSGRTGLSRDLDHPCIFDQHDSPSPGGAFKKGYKINYLL